MKNRSKLPTVGLVVTLLLATAACSPQPDAPRLLVFTKTAGFRHGSIESGIAAMEQLGATHGFDVEATEDSTQFTTDNLARFDAVVFLSTTGDVLDDEQQAAMEAYVRAGGGFVGIHAASDTEYDWPWYGGLVGGYFTGHPEIQEARIEVVDRSHPATAHLETEWIRTDEWYDLGSLAADLNVLMLLDEDSYEGATMGEPHPAAWFHEYDGGRAFYTALGHTEDSYREPAFLTHVLGGIRYVLDR